VADFCYYISTDDAWEIATTDTTGEDEEEEETPPTTISA
jgi:hypothetical protein